jgi:PKD repeat protein
VNKEKMMKTNPAAIALCILVLLIITPVLAAGSIVPRGNGGTSPPIILGMWEQDLSGVLENGDSVHSIAGSQFLPPCNGDERKTIQLYAIVTDDEFGADLKAVNGEIQQSNGSYHETVIMAQSPLPEGIWSAEQGGSASLIRYSSGFSSDAVMAQLRAGTASVWVGEVILPASQSGGLFKVTVTGIDTNDHSSLSLKNSFNYLPVACVEYDFSSINYGVTRLGFDNWVIGDEMLGTGDKPTVRNTGNVPVRIRITQDDMSFGQNYQGSWNVRYNVRIGNSGSSPTYSPYENILIPEIVNQGNNRAMDFLIQVFKGTGSHTGTMTLGYEALPLNPPAEDDTCELIQLVPLLGYTTLPTDPDGDCIYEDLNGNGRLDFADVVLYFNQMEWIAANEPTSAFDLNGNGRIDFADIVKLFNEI